MKQYCFLIENLSNVGVTMAAFLGISVWIALATVVPGLVTIAALFMGIAILCPDSVTKLAADLKGINEWVYAGGAIYNHGADAVYRHIDRRAVCAKTVVWSDQQGC